MGSQWWIVLGNWVLEDGNYTDFVTGERRQFALEFWWRRGQRLQPAPGAPSCRYTGRQAWYDVTGSMQRVPTRRQATTYVLDVGVCAYSVSPYERLDQPVDDGWVSGEIGLGIDYSAYRDELASLPGMPPLIYTWTIDEIRLDETPQIVVEHGHPLHTKPDGRPERVRDLTRESWRTVDRTRAWEEGGGYVLRCTLLRDDPVSSMAATGPPSPFGPLT
ncbi:MULTISPECIES: hypothetical protein [unclassified Nocardioides]|uniref:hypothetical protein n=1 Tax=unclassified Nocardioides TaxID=2615069 RepID=UPI003618C915